MGKNKGARIVITLECSCINIENQNKRNPGIFRYTSTKNRRNTQNRLELKKFCPQCNTHSLFKEIK
uniref:Large ribosomal subunit protein bL33c n=1 Tax=Asparagopsis taxiformis TaxID=260499 RepID=A0A1C9CBY5_9FLOR|nr:ribosomal protein L33 [Asparagopsis taxiformis]AOM65913.1 ribosomal protein L33 [Asparagopsis taxiformis]